MIQRLTEGGAFHPAFPFQSSMYYSDLFFLSIFFLIFFTDPILLFLFLIHTHASLFSSISFFVSTSLNFTMSTSFTTLLSRWMSDTDLSFSEEAGQQVKTQKLQNLTYSNLFLRKTVKQKIRRKKQVNNIFLTISKYFTEENLQGPPTSHSQDIAEPGLDNRYLHILIMALVLTLALVNIGI